MDKNALSSKEKEIKRKRVLKSVKMKKLAAVQKLLKNENDMEPWGRDAQAKVFCSLSPLIVAPIQPYLLKLYLNLISEVRKSIVRIVDRISICATTTRSISVQSTRYSSCFQAYI